MINADRLKKAASKLELTRMVRFDSVGFVDGVWTILQENRRSQERLALLEADNEELQKATTSLEQMIAEIRGML